MPLKKLFEVFEYSSSNTMPGCRWRPRVPVLQYSSTPVLHCKVSIEMVVLEFLVYFLDLLTATDNASHGHDDTGGHEASSRVWEDLS